MSVYHHYTICAWCLLAVQQTTCTQIACILGEHNSMSPSGFLSGYVNVLHMYIFNATLLPCTWMIYFYLQLHVVYLYFNTFKKFWESICVYASYWHVSCVTTFYGVTLCKHVVLCTCMYLYSRLKVCSPGRLTLFRYAVYCPARQ